MRISHTRRSPSSRCFFNPSERLLALISSRYAFRICSFISFSAYASASSFVKNTVPFTMKRARLVIEDHHGVTSYLRVAAAYERPVSDVLVSRVVVRLLQEEARCR